MQSVVLVPVPIVVPRPDGPTAGGGWLSKLPPSHPPKYPTNRWPLRQEIPSQATRDALDQGRRYLAERREQRRMAHGG
jgi:hypothetical protein